MLHVFPRAESVTYIPSVAILQTEGPWRLLEINIHRKSALSRLVLGLLCLYIIAKLTGHGLEDALF